MTVSTQRRRRCAAHPATRGAMPRTVRLPAQPPANATRCVLALGLACAVVTSAAVAAEPALLATFEDGDVAVLFPDPASGLPAPVQQRFSLPAEATPHGVSFRAGLDVLLADFFEPVLYRVAPDGSGAPAIITLTGRQTGNGTTAASPDGRFALSIGESESKAGAIGSSVVIDFAVDPPSVAPIQPEPWVKGFVTDAVDFAPDGRAFVCHSHGVSVLSPPYRSIDFTMPFPPLAFTPSGCRLSPDGTRLFVTRVLSETTLSFVNGVHTTRAPFAADSVFVTLPAPSDVDGLMPMAVSRNGQALIVGQQFLFPGSQGIRARAFVLRAPFDADTAYEEIALPPETTGAVCNAEGTTTDCPGFEHIALSHDDSLAILTGNSSAVAAGVPEAVPAVFVRNPFDAASRSAVAVQIAVAGALAGRGTGAVRFQPQAIFRDGIEAR